MSIGSPSHGPRPGELGTKTVDFVRGQLSAWRDDRERPPAESENRLNEQLSIFLNSRARSQFPMVQFNHQAGQQGRRSVDISATPAESVTIGASQYTIYTPFLVIEGKRLPAPAKDREREYVSGGPRETSGGIQRFKLGCHGSGLDLVAMIGYLQKGSATTWHKKINGWIEEFCKGSETDGCMWTDRETLELLDDDQKEGLAVCRSVHARSSSDATGEVEIQHLWIVMNGNRSPN